MSAVPSHIVAPKLDLVRPIVFLDAETTGLNANSDRVVELALVKVYPGGPVSVPQPQRPLVARVNAKNRNSVCNREGMGSVPPCWKQQSVQ